MDLRETLESPLLNFNLAIIMGFLKHGEIN